MHFFFISWKVVFIKGEVFAYTVQTARLLVASVRLLCTRSRKQATRLQERSVLSREGGTWSPTRGGDTSWTACLLSRKGEGFGY